MTDTQLTTMTSQEIQKSGPSGLVAAVTECSDKDLKLISQTIMLGAKREDVIHYAKICEHKGLDPFLGQIHAVPRNTKNRDGTYSKIWTFVVGVHGFRELATRTNVFDRDEVLLCRHPEKEPLDKDGEPLSDPVEDEYQVR